MNALMKLLFFFFLATSLLVTACKDDDDPIEPCNYAVELSAEATAFSNASTAYGQDQSQANCLSLKSAAQAYINAAAQYQSCANAAGQGVEFQQSIDGAQASIDALPC
jgi:hypothetical protein